jgi:hypothetical protein
LHEFGTWHGLHDFLHRLREKVEEVKEYTERLEPAQRGAFATTVKAKDSSSNLAGLEGQNFQNSYLLKG